MVTVMDNNPEEILQLLANDGIQGIYCHHAETGIRQQS